MDTTFFLHILGTAAAAICFAVVLVADDNALLCPVIRWCRVTYRTRTCRELDDQRWWKPIWGCPACVSGQWGFWAYLYHYHAAYCWWQHLYFASLTLLAALLMRGLYSWTQQQP